MVKNQKGGSGHKRQARKHVTSDTSIKRTRYSQDPLEVYAICLKAYGGGNFGVKCQDGKERLCVLRKKFKGRRKQDNIVVAGAYLLVGLRDFENVTEGKKEKCDLLEVYSEYDKKVLEQNVKTINWMIFKEEDTKNDDYIEFSNGPNYYLNEIEENKEDHGSSGQSDDELDIDIDEI
tara:strand:- start:661 stop:1191 length:531 start_codon:yes stop_codon:yes gene_type:complete